MRSSDCVQRRSYAIRTWNARDAVVDFNVNKCDTQKVSVRRLSEDEVEKEEANRSGLAICRRRNIFTWRLQMPINYWRPAPANLHRRKCPGRLCYPSSSRSRQLDLDLFACNNCPRDATSHLHVLGAYTVSFVWDRGVKLQACKCTCVLSVAIWSSRASTAGQASISICSRDGGRLLHA